MLACCEVDKSYSEDVLTADEKEVWNSFESSVRSAEFLAARGLVRDMICEMGLNKSNFSLKKDPQGKPFGEYEGDRYFISIAHSKEQVICGISPTVALGVDVEPKNRIIPDRLRGRMLTKREQSALAGEQTLRIWTLKEAAVKLKGDGLRIGLKEWEMRRKNKNLFSATFSDEEKISIISITHKNHWLAVAFQF